MQVYLPAITGHVPSQMIRALSVFLDFCYLSRRDIITEMTLGEMESALSRFHENRTIFFDHGVRPTGFSLPRQHSLMHYVRSIQLFGSPNGLCSSITESKHIKAVKEPWRRSSHFQALGQMLLTNQWLDKLAASRVDFEARGMLHGPCLPAHLVALQAAYPDMPPAHANIPKLQPEAEEGDHDDDGEAIIGPRTLNHVVLSKNTGT
jgi:hypothetical protein